MENDYSSFMQKNDAGEVTSFDEAKLASFIDSAISKGVDSGINNYKAKVEKEQNFAKMTAEQQYAEREKEFQQKVDEWEATMKNQKRDIVVEKAKSKLCNDFSEAEINSLIKNITDDEKESMKFIDVIVSERKKYLEEIKKKLVEELQSNQPTSNSQANAQDDKSSQEPVKKTSQEILNHYK